MLPAEALAALRTERAALRPATALAALPAPRGADGTFHLRHGRCPQCGELARVWCFTRTGTTTYYPTACETCAGTEEAA